MKKEIVIQTADGVKLAADWWDIQAAGTALLLHMMPATKESWAGLAAILTSRGCNVLAIDFRGHGQSGGGDYHVFAPEEHQKYILDAEAAVGYIRNIYTNTQLVIAGASIGANETLLYMTQHTEVVRGVALSAGLDYHGVRAIDYVGHLAPNQKVLFVASLDDGRASGNCGQMAEALWLEASCQKQKIIYEIGGHGTDMFARHAELPGQVADFLLNDRQS